MSEAIAKLLSPRSVAVIGASADLKKTTGRPVAYLQKHSDLVCRPHSSRQSARGAHWRSGLLSRCGLVA